MREVGGAVERIDVPAVVGFGLAARAFLADDAVLRPARLQTFDNQFFGGAIGLGHQVDVALVLDGDAPREVAHQKRAGFARDRFDFRQVARSFLAVLE